MGQTDRDTIKFWTVLAATILVVSILVMLIDMSIKAAILQESNSLRLVIEEQRNRGARKTAANPDGADNDSSNPSVLLDIDATGLEVGDVANGHKAATHKPRSRRQPPYPSGD